MKKSIKIRKFINKEVKVNDAVKLIDGSGLTSVDFENEVFIVCAYPELTKSHKNIEDLIFTVLQTNVTDYVCFYENSSSYLQDLLISVNGNKFRTCSKFVTKEFNL